MANQGGNGNGHSGGDVIVTLHSAVVHMQDSMVRHHGETQEAFGRVQETFVRMQETLVRMQETFSRHHKESMEDVSKIAEILGAVGDKLKDHERRLAAVEAKVF